MAAKKKASKKAAKKKSGRKPSAAFMSSGDDLQRRAHNIESIEKRADRIARNTIELLHKTFITPLDREDIHQLISKMDDILDLIEDAAQLMKSVQTTSAATRRAGGISRRRTAASSAASASQAAGRR